MTRVTDAVRSVKPEAVIKDREDKICRVMTLDYSDHWMTVCLYSDGDRSGFLARAIVALNALQDEVEGR